MREQSAETDRPVEQEFLSVIREYERVIYKVCYLYMDLSYCPQHLHQFLSQGKEYTGNCQPHQRD